MDIVSIIDKYVDYNIKVDELAKKQDESIHNYNRLNEALNYDYQDSEYETRLNNDARNAMDTWVSTSNELDRTRKAIKEIDNTYRRLISSISKDELINIINSLKTKRDELELQKDNINKKRIYAKTQSELSYANKEYDKEREYDNISARYYMEITKINKRVQQYNSFINTLSFKLDSLNNINTK